MEELGRFKLRGQMSGGPYVMAYEALDGATRCVVKVLKDEAVPADAGRRAGLVRALEGLKAIEHPSAVRVLDSGEQGGKLFVASEFMGCPTLAQKLEGEKRLAEPQVILYIRQSAQALDKARDLGYCHGDLTARNVYVVSQEKVKLSDFSIKYLVENPPDLAALGEHGEGQGGTAAKDEWVTAEDLLRTKGKKATQLKPDDDFVGLGVLMMQMLGFEIPKRSDGEALEAYRDSLLRKFYPKLSDSGSGVSVHVADVVRRLLTPGDFDSPGEVVVELASAMLLGRTFGRPKAAAAAKAPTPAAETAQVRVGKGEEDLDFEVEAPEAPHPAEEALAAEPAGAAEGDTMFFVWTDRRSGRFFVLRDGEEIALGRDPDACDVVVMDPAVSRKHCVLSKEGGAVRILDAGSSNGTFVNDERIQSVQVKASDRLRIGTTRLYMALPGAK